MVKVLYKSLLKQREKSKMKKYIVLTLILFLFNGCVATLLTIDDTKLYSGTRLNVHSIKENVPEDINWMKVFKILNIIDLPFSLVFDTILLPYKTYLIINEDKNATSMKIKMLQTNNK